MNMLSVARRTTATRVVADAGQKVVLYDVDWHAYKTICGAIVDHPVRLTYANGALEIMVTSPRHDRYKSHFALIIFTLARFFGKKIATCGSFTHQREDLQKGFEPDQCFYLKNFQAIKGKLDIDLTLDPPPDLMIEVDVSRSSMDRMSIFAAFGVPEVWRFDTTTIQVHVLQNGVYATVATSLAFPEIPVNDLVTYLDIAIQDGEITMVEKLERWLAKLSGGTRPSRKKRKGK